MNLHPLDLAIIAGYFVVVIALGLWSSRKGTKDMDGYFLGGKSLPWWILGISDASGMFDISGTMYLVYALFIYGLKSIWLPWAWPTFNQIFLMMFMSAWTRRSNVLTGAQWIETRFGRAKGGTLAHLSVVAFALINVVGLLAYAFKGIGKFAVVMLPWRFTHTSVGILSDDNIYALIFLGITSLYAIKGGMLSVVVTEILQFLILTITAIIIGTIAMISVSHAMVAANIPHGWLTPFFGLHLNLDWNGILNSANTAFAADGNDLFSAIVGLLFFKGVLASLAGPAPNYDMQRILATRSPREASLMNGMVNVVLFFPRYLMIAGITALALAYCMPELRAMPKPDFEKVLPLVLSEHVPTGVLGFLLAGLMAAFMSNFAATLNAAPAYVVNDIYRRFVRKDAGAKREVQLSRLASIAFLIIGVTVGLLTDRITGIMMWLVGALYGGFVVANVLKWYWWRFNGYGYFWGMVCGISGAMFVPSLLDAVFGHSVNAIFSFIAIFGLSVVGCLVGTLLTPPENDEILLSFYRTVNPWGFWGPIREKAVLRDPEFIPNPSAKRDLSNVVIGIVWQTCLMMSPVYLVFHEWTGFFVTAAIIAAASITLKFTWYDHLDAKV